MEESYQNLVLGSRYFLSPTIPRTRMTPKMTPTTPSASKYEFRPGNSEGGYAPSFRSCTATPTKRTQTISPAIPMTARARLANATTSASRKDNHAKRFGR